MDKQDAGHEPKRNHVEHFCETSYLNRLVHVPPRTIQVHCRLWNVEWGGAQASSVKKVEC